MLFSCFAIYNYIFTYLSVMSIPLTVNLMKGEEFVCFIYQDISSAITVSIHKS